MVNTKKSSAILEKSDARQFAPHDDAYTVRDGHYVGHDGFIVPSSFSEFYQRFPTYAADWVRRRVRGSASENEADDWTQELLLHLAALPSGSIHRKDGKEDVIQTFVPDRMHGANEPRFRSFINRCLSNKFNTIYRKSLQRPLSNPSNLSFDFDSEYGANDEFCHANSTFLRARERRNRVRDEQRLRLGEFVRLAESSIPGLRRFLEAFGETGTWEGTAILIGRKQCDFRRRSIRQFAMRMV
jgi:hypothetical protein